MFDGQVLTNDQLRQLDDLLSEFDGDFGPYFIGPETQSLLTQAVALAKQVYDLRETVALERELSHKRFLRIEELGGRQP